MRRFLRDVGTFVLLQVAVLAAVDATYMHYEGDHHYLAGYLDKARRLEETKSPRILIVGGSSAAFGVNSAALERVSGQPVVNLGLNAGLGLRFILNQASSAIRPGDLVVLSPEYALFARGEIVDARTMLNLLRIAPSTTRFVPARKVPVLLDQGLSAVTQRVRLVRHVVQAGPIPPHPFYNRAAFDERGDVTAHLEMGSREGGDQHVIVPTPEEAEPICRFLAAFAHEVGARGARVVIMPTPIPGDDFDAQQQKVAALWAYVGETTGIEILGAGKRYGRELFLDTSYHLTKAGRQVRSREVIRLLRGHLTAPRTADIPED